MAFQVGQKVVCVDLRTRGDGLNPFYRGTMLPLLGAVYTVRHVFDAGRYGYDGEGALLLAEVSNPVRYYMAPAGPVECEQFFLDYRFRPLRSTSIEVFTAMLEPAPRKPADLVDA